ncbi:MAG: hypothetical protein QM569_09740 [Acidovorax sp.]|uniref:hypothetical protein n=1 Tax=Acidovorax sp. TaxID=1872122 RepID=UPI0039E34CCF
MIQKENAQPRNAELSAPNQGSDSATAQADDKAFATLQAQFALRGHQLRCVTSPNGTQAFWAERWGLVRYLPSLHDAAMFLTQIGGRA